jgi:integrase
VHLFKLYRELVPKHEGALFRQVRKGKVTQQKRGKSFFYDLPKRIALFLRLDAPEKYTGHAIRRTATTWLAERGASTAIIQKFGGWKSTSVAQGYIDDSDKLRAEIAEKIDRPETKAITLSAAPQSSGISFTSMTGCTINVNYHVKE